MQNRQARIGLGLVIALALFCFAGPLLYHTNQVTVRLNLATLPPSGALSAGHRRFRATTCSAG